MANEQWPLTAAATQILLDTPSAGAKRGAEPDKKAAAQLALKELIFRGAYRIEITRTRRRDEIKLIPQGHIEVPKSLLDSNAFGATDGLLDPVGDVDRDGVDSGVSAVDSALDSVSSSIDAGVAAGADAGGGGDIGGGGDGRGEGGG